MTQRPGVDHIGVCVMFMCYDIEGRVLMHVRGPACRDEHGLWCGGAGQLEFGEDWFECVAREVREEYGVDPAAIDYCGTTNVIREADGVKTHWIALLFAVFIDRPGDVRICEPDKITELGWFWPGELPGPRHSRFDTHFDIILPVILGLERP